VLSTPAHLTCRTVPSCEHFPPIPCFDHGVLPNPFLLKRQCHTRDFLLQVFSWIIIPQAPENSFKISSNFFKNFGDIHKSTCTTGSNGTGGKYSYRWQMFPQIFENFETALMECSVAGEKLVHEKNLKSKISWHCPWRAVVPSFPYTIVHLSWTGAQTPWHWQD
jgi:hypothetical protein